MVRVIILAVTLLGPRVCSVSSSEERAKITVDRFPLYNLKVELLPAEHRLKATGTVCLPMSDTPREEFIFNLDSRMRNLFIEFLEPSIVAGPATLERVGGDRWRIRPRGAAPSGKAVLMRFSYEGGEEIGPRFYLGPEGSFASGEGIAWYPRLDNVTRASGELQFLAPSGYTVIATGLLRDTVQDGFLFKVSQPTTFSFAVGKYRVYHQESGAVPLSLYLLHPRKNMDKRLDTVSRMLEVLTEQFGPLPYQKFALVEAPSEQARRAGFGGVSLEGFVLLSSENIDAFNLALVSHETSHQWWSDSIKPKAERGRYLLSEAMAQFGALRVVEVMEGPAVAERFRRSGYPGYEFFQSGTGYLMLAAGGFDETLADLPGGGLSHALANSKGFLVWHMLSRTVGPESFRVLLQRFTQQHMFQDVDWEEFLRAIEVGTGRDLKWFYKQWFEQTGAPDCQLTWKQQLGTLHGKVTQSSPFYQAAVEVRVQGDGRHHFIQTIEIRGPKTEFTLPVKFRVRSVTLDPHFQVLRWTPEYRAQAKTMIPFTRVMAMTFQGQVAQAHQHLQSAVESIPEPDQYAARFLIEFSRAWLFKNQDDPVAARKHLEVALASPTRRSDMLPYAYYMLAYLAKATNDPITLRQAVTYAATAESTLGVRTGWADAASNLLTGAGGLQ